MERACFNAGAKEAGSLFEGLKVEWKPVKLRIATAYISSHGVAMLKELKERYALQTGDIEIYLSKKFAVGTPAQALLQQLDGLCEVYIVSKCNLHAKVYWLEGIINSCVVYGSANFTNSGFVSNLEFCTVREHTKQERQQPEYADFYAKLEAFFKKCSDKATALDDEVMALYAQYDEERKPLEQLQNNADAVLERLGRAEIPALPDKSILENRFFVYEDYECLSPDFETIPNVPQRLVVQDKLKQLHNHLRDDIQSELGLSAHWAKDCLTSRIEPCKYNLGHVGWMCVRYGKPKKEFDLINTSFGNWDDKEEYQGFPKHACLQYSLMPDCFTVSLFHAVRNGAVDRYWLDEHFEEQKTAILPELERLKGHGYTWYCYDYNGDGNEFSLDNEEISDFVEFYKGNVQYREGRESYLMKRYKPADALLSNEQALCNEIYRQFALLTPLYNLVSWRMKL